MPQIIHRQLGDLAGVLSKFDSPSIFLVADKAACQQAGANLVLDPLLQDYQTHCFHQFTPNPDIQELETAVADYRQHNPDIVIAVGGGTALDLGKLISLFGEQTRPCRDLVLDPLSAKNEPARLIAIPTTAGTGSEATHFAVLYLDGLKYSVADPRIIPSHVILDPDLTTTMPAALTASTGLDAFSQAIESMWSLLSTNESRQYARQAIDLVWEHLTTAVTSPTSNSRQAMCQAAHLSGKAINISKTTAPHAISYAITSLYGVPHGRAVALTLPSFFRAANSLHSGNCLDPRGTDHVRAILRQVATQLGCSSPAEAPARITGFIQSLGCPTTLEQVGITDDKQLDEIIAKINLQRLVNYPVKLDSKTLRDILKSQRQPAPG